MPFTNFCGVLPTFSGGFLGLPVTIPVGLDIPSLNFSFAQNKDLTDTVSGETSLITFSRPVGASASPGTYVDAAGLVKTAQTNLLLYSEKQYDAVWLKTNTSVSGNQIVAPDGKQTATRVNTGANIVAAIYQGVSFTVNSGDVFVFSVWLKSDSPTQTNIGINGLSNGSNNVGQLINLTTQWQRFHFTITAAADTGLYALVGNFSGVTNQPATSFYMWGAQLEEGSTPTPYIKTTTQAMAAPRFDHDPVTGESLGLLMEEARTNQITDSENFGGSGWTTVGANRTTGIISPLNKLSTLLTASSSTAYVRYTTNKAVNTRYVLSVFAKADTTSFVYLRDLSQGVGPSAWFDLSSGTVETVESGLTAQIKDFGNGWYRCSIIGVSGNPIANNLIDIGVCDVDGSRTSTNGISAYFDGAQLEAGPIMTSYVPTAGSALTRAIDLAFVQDDDFSITNLLLYSESFDVSYWAKTDATVTVNAIAAPDGQTTADRIEWSGVSSKRVYKIGLPSTLGVVSVYAKADQETVFSIWTNSAGKGSIFDLAAGTATPYPGGAASTWCSIEPVGNGWYLCSHFYNVATTDVNFYGRNGSTFTPTNPTDGLYLWGAQLTATEYPVDYVTTRNLLQESQDFERWDQFRSTILNDVALAPDGTMTADKIREDTSASITHGVGKLFSPNLLASTTYTFSFYAKAAERTWVAVGSNNSIGLTNVAYFDLQNGVTGAPGPFSSTAIQDVGGGWYRCSATGNVAANATANFYIVSATGNLGASYTGDGTSGLFIWGAQIEPGSTATNYVRTVDVTGKRYRWFEPTEGTVLVDAEANPGFTTVLASISNFHTSPISEASRLLETRFRTNGYGGVVYSVVPGASVFDGPMAIPFKGKIAGAAELNNARSCLDGVLSPLDISIGIPAGIGVLRLGSIVSGLPLNGHIKRFTYWRKRLPDTTLQKITS